ncbi:DUF4244 domain-containing protein [Microlunatus sp. GCM10028923]|uniref:DUF4244 domain-containing protein n=1 Tax=Microlunatus sp. GCM10028923 TaxID=3273400 RepID=UPI00361B8C54
MSEIMKGTKAELELVDAEPGARKPVLHRDERGLVSAEWVLGIVAAAALAGVLLAIVTSGPVEESLVKVVLDIIGRLTGLLK